MMKRQRRLAILLPDAPLIKVVKNRFPHATRSVSFGAQCPRLIRRPEWDATGESFWCILNKLLYSNRLRPRSVLNTFLTTDCASLKKFDRYTRIPYLRLDRQANIQRAVVLRNTTLTEEIYPLAFVDAYVYSSDVSNSNQYALRYCSTCLAMGFHTPLFQLRNVNRCPWHNVLLKSGCPTCGESIPMHLPSNGLLKPFECRNGHSLWPGLIEARWHPGPRHNQRRALLDVSQYIKASCKALDPRSDARLAFVSRWGLNGPAWDPHFHIVRDPPSLLARLTAGDRSQYESAISPVRLDCIPTQSGALRARLFTEYQQAKSRRDDKLALPAVRYFCENDLALMLDEYTAFFSRLEQTIKNYHSECSIGLHWHRLSENWTYRAEDVCIWRAALILARAESGYRCRIYPTRALTKRAFTCSDNFVDWFYFWTNSVWRFLQLEDRQFQKIKNGEFCRWLNCLLWRFSLEQLYVEMLAVVVKAVEKQRYEWLQKIPFIEPLCSSTSALVDFSLDYPRVELALEPQRFADALRACRRGVHDVKGISMYV